MSYCETGASGVFPAAGFTVFDAPVVLTAAGFATLDAPGVFPAAEVVTLDAPEAPGVNVGAYVLGVLPE